MRSAVGGRAYGTFVRALDLGEAYPPLYFPVPRTGPAS
jgi:hypothetical protein